MVVLTDAQRRQFDDEGYLVVEDVLDPIGDIAPVIAGYAEVLDGIARQFYAEGAISSLHGSLPFYQRLIQIAVESGRNFDQHFDISLPLTRVRPDTPVHVGPAVFKLLSHPRLLDVVEDLIGPEIAISPVQHIRMKLPQHAVADGNYSAVLSKVYWHQDNGTVLPEADESTILTVWLPLNEATVENGCLEVIPNSHRDGLLTHCAGDKHPMIPDQIIPELEHRCLPMRPGSLLLFHPRTVHCSLENTTNDVVRLSFDLRYLPIGQPTGRPTFPTFNVRSKAHPETVLHDPVAWAHSWYAARERLVEIETPEIHRWDNKAPVCA
jgi:phytanoyl-CoA hydroxylase